MPVASCIDPPFSERDQGMPVSRDSVTAVLYQCIDTLNEQLGPSQRLPKSPEARLSGDEGGLDSLGFVSLVALVEEACAERFGRTLVLTDGAGGWHGADPFASVGALAEHIALALGRPREGR